MRRSAALSRIKTKLTPKIARLLLIIRGTIITKQLQKMLSIALNRKIIVQSIANHSWIIRNTPMDRPVGWTSFNNLRSI